MKILLKILAALVVIIIALIFILPAIYKSEIITLTKMELNKNVNATVDFDDIDLSLFSSFPDFNISIYGLNIVGKNEFENDTFWDELLHRLVERDLIKQEGGVENVMNMDIRERFEKEEPLEKMYDTEFEVNGLDNIRI